MFNKNRLYLGIPLLGYLSMVFYSFYLLFTRSIEIDYIHYIVMISFIVPIILRLNLKEIYYFGIRYVIPSLIIYCIYFYAKII